MTSELLQFQDVLQQRFDLSKYSIVRDLILVGVVYVTYVYLPFSEFTSFAKMYLLALVIRYAMSELTQSRNSDTNKKHFHISGHFAMFMIMLGKLSSAGKLFTGNVYMYYAILAGYGLLNIVTHAHYTTDIINTYFLVMFLQSVN